jgi:mycofactocin precursor
MTEPTNSDLAVEEAHADSDDQLVESDLLVEEISIDGMCGVY